MKFLLLLLLFFAPVQANDAWLTLGTIGEETYQLHQNSLEIGETDGMKYASAVGQVVKDSSAKFYLWMVLEEDCIQRYGTLYVGNLQGKLVAETSFVDNGASFASGVAQGICEAAFD